MREALRLRSRHDRAVAALAIPALGSLIADPLLGLVDTAFVGRVGSEALAGLGVAVAVFGVSFFVFNFLEYGTTTEVAKAVGAQDLGSAGRAAWTSLVLAATSGVAVSAVLVVTAGPVASAMGARGGVRSAAVTYLMIRALAAPAMLLVRVGHGIYRGHQNTKTPLAVTIGMNGVNLLLDPILIFGLGMGVAGAAWATVVAQWLGAAMFGVLLYRGRDRYGLRGQRPVVAEVRAFLRVGRDLAIRSGSLLLTFTLATAIAARVSESAVAAHQVLSQIFLFLALAVDALAIAAQALVGTYLGAGERRVAIGLADRLLVLGVAVGVGIAGLLVVIGPFVGGWFTDDPAVIEAIDGVYWLLVVMQPAAAAVFVWDGVFIGAGDFTFLAGAMVVAGLVSSGILLAVLPLGWGLTGVWSALVALMILRLVTLAWRRAAAGSPLRR